METIADFSRLRVQLAWFFETIREDPRIGVTHICIYMALIQMWDINHFQSPIAFNRQEIMRLAKISSSATYHKCLKDFVEYKYFRYIPSCNPFLKSLVYLN